MEKNSFLEYVRQLSNEELSEALKMAQAESRKREEAEEKYYIFSGTWSWGCWAKNQQEAFGEFESAYADDIDINYEHVEVEICDN